MQFPNFDPVLISLGPLDIRWYALAYVAGLALGWWYAARLLRAERLWPAGRSPINTTQLDDLMLWIAVGVIGGGRLGYALFYKPSLYAQLFTGDGWGERLALLRLWDGGMSFHGGLIGVALAIVIFAWRNRVSVLTLGDLAAPVAPLGLFFGRIANFINGELWGRPTDAPWGVVFCNDNIARLYGGVCPPQLQLPRHPSQLYEAALEGVLIFVVLSLMAWKGGALRRPGLAVGVFLVLYGLSRAVLETVREPDAHMPEALQGVVTMGMLLSIPMILAGAWLAWRAWSRPPVQA